MPVVITLTFIFGLCVALLGNFFQWGLSNIIALEALIVAIGGAVLNFLYTQRTFKAAHYPIPLTVVSPTVSRDILNIYIINPHQSILIGHVKLNIKIEPSKTNPKWLRRMKPIDLCALSVKSIPANQTQEAGMTQDLVKVMNEHYPGVLTLTENEDYKVVQDYSFDFIAKIKYIPLIHGGKEQQVTYTGKLKPVTSNELNLKRWDVDILEYPRRRFSRSSIRY